MVPHKIKILTPECELLWNMIILKSEPPYCAFTQFNSHNNLSLVQNR
jgi:hypothetical protein